MEVDYMIAGAVVEHMTVVVAWAAASKLDAGVEMIAGADSSIPQIGVACIEKGEWIESDYNLQEPVAGTERLVNNFEMVLDETED